MRPTQARVAGLGLVEDGPGGVEDPRVARIGRPVAEGGQIQHQGTQQSGGARLRRAGRPPTQGGEYGTHQSVDPILPLQVEHPAEQQDGLPPFRAVDGGGAIPVGGRQQPDAFGVPAAEFLGGQILLEGQMPEAQLVTAAHDDAAVDLLLAEKGVGAFDCLGIAVVGRGEAPREALGRPAAADLDLTPPRVGLHGERQIGQEPAAAPRLLPAGAPLAGLAQPPDDGRRPPSGTDWRVRRGSPDSPGANWRTRPGAGLDAEPWHAP